MGLTDDIVNIDDAQLQCSNGHRISVLRTKDLDPNRETYLLLGGTLIHVLRWSSPRARAEHGVHGDTGDKRDDELNPAWRIQDGIAFREERFKTETVTGRFKLRAYGQCSRCEPVLIRTDGLDFFGDIIEERSVYVDFELTLSPDEAVHAVNISGTRQEFERRLLDRGLHVLRDDDPLALAHRTAKEAKARLEALDPARIRERYGMG
jgi:hypothetical protein